MANSRATAFIVVAALMAGIPLISAREPTITTETGSRLERHLQEFAGGKFKDPDSGDVYTIYVNPGVTAAEAKAKCAHLGQEQPNHESRDLSIISNYLSDQGFEAFQLEMWIKNLKGDVCTTLIGADIGEFGTDSDYGTKDSSACYGKKAYACVKRKLIKCGKDAHGKAQLCRSGYKCCGGKTCCAASSTCCKGTSICCAKGKKCCPATLYAKASCKAKC